VQPTAAIYVAHGRWAAQPVAQRLAALGSQVVQEVVEGFRVAAI